MKTWIIPGFFYAFNLKRKAIIGDARKLVEVSFLIQHPFKGNLNFRNHDGFDIHKFEDAILGQFSSKTRFFHATKRQLRI